MTYLESQQFTGASMGVTHNELKALCEAGPGRIQCGCSVVGRKYAAEIRINTHTEEIAVEVNEPEWGWQSRIMSKKNPTPLDWGIFQTYNNLIKT